MHTPLQKLREETDSIIESSHYISRYLLHIKHLDTRCNQIVEKVSKATKQLELAKYNQDRSSRIFLYYNILQLQGRHYSLSRQKVEVAKQLGEFIKENQGKLETALQSFIQNHQNPNSFKRGRKSTHHRTRSLAKAQQQEQNEDKVNKPITNNRNNETRIDFSQLQSVMEQSQAQD